MEDRPVIGRLEHISKETDLSNVVLNVFDGKVRYIRLESGVRFIIVTSLV